MDDHLLFSILKHAFPGATATILPPSPGSENRHGLVSMQSGHTLFVKFYTSEKRFQREGIVLNTLARSHSWVIPPLYADKEQNIYWRASPYKKLRPVVLNLMLARDWGRLLGMMHTTPVPQDLERVPRANDLVETHLHALLAFPEIKKRAEQLWMFAAPRILSESAFQAFEPVLLMNDFGLRNTFIRADSEQMILIDFENSATGDAHWDMGKCWDRELHDPTLRDCFLEGYREQRPQLSGTWPDPAILWTTRFVEALSIFPYAHRVREQPFFEHGLEKLTILETEARQWV